MYGRCCSHYHNASKSIKRWTYCFNRPYRRSLPVVHVVTSGAIASCPQMLPCPATWTKSSVNPLLQVVDNLQFQNVSYPISHRRSQCPLGASTTRETRKTNSRQLGLLYRWDPQTD